MQLWSKQRKLLLDPLKLLPPDRTVLAPTAQHFAPVMFHSPIDGQQCTKISCNAVACMVTTEHLIGMIHQFSQRQVPHPPHLVLQAHESASQS